ncbi:MULTISPECIES: Dam family site-specific DNA-(adenine-N6)-methyltransferase [Bacillaceae]|uniref:Site-specific DNA-methyltransferase (adenine-specific) n=1 Tax=Evansella alkalicola TaxID=745819 RepID=A0ABS6JZ25_9BACI|nr:MULTISPECIES: Dam family site-specific DNA-(adenine-N6)-methyltransferase [Bacillaceae]MBU9722340.1 Dam family site-specific DNA-(adenine-N6)-methyltransferase [Bacillus alkalicola]
MRFIGSKVNLLSNIESFISENITDSPTVFMDMFSGTGTVAEYFKKDYCIYSNDSLYFSYILQKARIENNQIPKFSKLKQNGISDPLEYLETAEITIKPDYFITHHYSPYNGCERMYFSVENASRIDFIRQQINSWKESNLINEKEFAYILATLIEAIPFISNISGTYGAYLKHWDKRALSNLKLQRLEVTDNYYTNKSFNEDANDVIERVRGDVLYIDTPYNSRQYISNYHLLETIARYDYPEIYGKTGLRPYEHAKSAYCSKRDVLGVFSDLIEKAKFRHIIVSYSTEGLMSVDDIEQVLKKHGVADTYKLAKIPYRKYKSKHKQEESNLNELLFYIQKDIPLVRSNRAFETAYQNEGAANTNEEIHSEQTELSYTELDLFSMNGIKVDAGSATTNVATLPRPPVRVAKYPAQEYIKSPLNYIGGKYKLLKQIIPLFPEDINTFVDLFAGGLNVGINVKANSIIANDINTFVIGVLKEMASLRVDEVLEHIHKRIQEYNLSKENEEGFKKFRDYYNQTKHPLDLYTLICYSFNYQFRFNNNQEYNNPFGRNRSQFSPALELKLVRFIEALHSKNIEFSTEEFDLFHYNHLSKGDFVYCDPPYLITTGSYNDGNRGFKDWNEDQEYKLLQILDDLNGNGVRFALSNVLKHKGQTNHILLEWAKKYHINYLNYDYANSSHNTTRGESEEVLITNYSD